MSSLEKLIPDLDALLPELEEVYKDLHRHPELSMYEYRTAEIAANYLVRYGYEVTREIGVTGVVGVLRNGEGPVVMLRADMDALPKQQACPMPATWSPVTKTVWRFLSATRAGMTCMSPG
jgi:hippurate hydrolase